MYRFGLFDPTRMRGIPSAGVRFSEVGMVRASYSFNLLNRYRLALYADHAWGRTPDDRDWHADDRDRRSRRTSPDRRRRC